MSRHCAYIPISPALLSSLLDLKGATIWGGRLDDYGTIEFLVEHPDLPEVNEGDAIKQVNIRFVKTYGDNGVLLRLERIYPEKKVSTPPSKKVSHE